jgi:hypothetical protein
MKVKADPDEVLHKAARKALAHRLQKVATLRLRRVRFGPDWKWAQMERDYNRSWYAE